MSAPLPPWILGLFAVLPFVGPAGWGVICSLIRRRLVGTILLVLPYAVTVVLWPIILRLDTFLLYPVLLYAIPVLFGYGIGITLAQRYRRLRTQGDLLMGVGLVLMLLGFETVLVDHLSSWAFGLTIPGSIVLAIGVIIEIPGVILSTRRYV